MARLYRAKAEAVDSLAPELEAWQGRHAEAMSVRDLEEWVAAGCDIAAAAAAAPAAVWKLAMAGKPLDHEGLGEAVLHFMGQAAGLCGKLLALADAWAAKGYAVDGAASLRGAAEAVALARADFLAGWPWPDRAAWGRAMADVAAGRYRTAREIARERGSPGPR